MPGAAVIRLRASSPRYSGSALPELAPPSPPVASPEVTHSQPTRWSLVIALIEFCKQSEAVMSPVLPEWWQLEEVLSVLMELALHSTINMCLAEEPLSFIPYHNGAQQGGNQLDKGRILQGNFD